MPATAQAQSNIALVKYWGKKDPRLNTPAAGSISITLDSLWTRTRVDFDGQHGSDRFVLNGTEQTPPAKLLACVDLLRDLSGRSSPVEIISDNNFPTGAGLASSASGYAALVVAINDALQLGLSARALSVIARRGSGSAARSIFGGFVEMMPGSSNDGDDSHACPLLDAGEWPLEVVVAITDEAAKRVGSTEGMQSSADTSPYYPTWIRSTPADLDECRAAIQERDFEALGGISEHSCLKMHALAMSARPGLLYWNAATVACIQRIEQLRASGVGVFFTIDAGPQVKAICDTGYRDAVAAALAELPGVQRVIVSGLGPGARVVES